MNLTRAINRDLGLAHAIAEIESAYGDRVSVDTKRKSLIKFGRNDSVGTIEEMVWLLGGMETYPTANTIDTIASDNAGDTQEVVIEGHTISGSDLTFVTQTVDLNGTTDVSLPTPLYRASRLYNNDSTDFAGTVTVSDSNAVTNHLQTSGNNNQSLKAATSISSQDYWIVVGAVFSVNRQNSRSVDFKLQVRRVGKVFRTRFTASVNSTGGSVQVDFEPHLIVPKNSDVRVTATSSGSDTGVDATLKGYLAKVE